MAPTCGPGGRSFKATFPRLFRGFDETAPSCSRRSPAIAPAGRIISLTRWRRQFYLRLSYPPILATGPTCGPAAWDINTITLLSAPRMPAATADRDGDWLPVKPKPGSRRQYRRHLQRLTNMFEIDTHRWSTRRRKARVSRYSMPYSSTPLDFLIETLPNCIRRRGEPYATDHRGLLSPGALCRSSWPESGRHPHPSGSRVRTAESARNRVDQRCSFRPWPRAPDGRVRDLRGSRIACGSLRRRDRATSGSAVGGRMPPAPDSRDPSRPKLCAAWSTQSRAYSEAIAAFSMSSRSRSRHRASIAQPTLNRE